MPHVDGLHHVTAIAGKAQENLEFYAGVLGMRLVKRSVNQDDPGTYHLFYADADGRPGTDLTFFPMADAVRGRAGHGLATEVALAVPPDSIDWWHDRLVAAGLECDAVETRFGEEVLPFADPHGQRVALVGSEGAMGRDFTAWRGSSVPAERQIRGLEGARIELSELPPSTAFLADALGYRETRTEGDWHRFEVGEGGSGRWLDLRDASGGPHALRGVGTIHHLAFRVADDEHQGERRMAAVRAGARATPVIDRFWFRSVYFLEPGGVLFELATDGPGFAVDEAAEHLGESLVLPPWLEGQRSAIERVLPPLRLPG